VGNYGRYARRFAKDLPPRISAHDALMAFANGIERQYRDPTAHDGRMILAN